MRTDPARPFILLLLLTLACVAAVTLTEGVVRGVGALILTFVLPGYAVLWAWFPERRLTPSSRILFTLALSATVIILGALVLHFTFGLNSLTWTLWLASITIIHIGIAMVRGTGQWFFIEEESWPSMHWNQLLLIGVGLVIAVGAVLAARTGVVQQPRPGFTQLWLVPDPGTTEERVRIGIRNEEQMDVGYRLVLTAGGAVVSDELLVVRSDEAWESWLPVSADTPQPIRAELYRMDMPGRLYRTVTLWLDGPTSDTTGAVFIQASHK